MTDRPILFSAPMVRALLDGRKTQTRRVLKPQPPEGLEAGFLHVEGDPRPRVTHGRTILRAPFSYAPGDRLWVREGLRMDPAAHPANVYLADGERVIWRTREQAVWLNEYANVKAPGIHMPRWASRLTLLVTDVRVQRLQDIEGQHPTESDAIAEGVNAIHHGDGEYYYSAFRTEPHPKNWCDPADAFRELWNSIHGPDAWAANPWVAAISFDVVRGNIDQVQP